MSACKLQLQPDAQNLNLVFFEPLEAANSAAAAVSGALTSSVFLHPERMRLMAAIQGCYCARLLRRIQAHACARHFNPRPAITPPPVRHTELSLVNQRFIDLLSLGNITRPNPAVLAAITRRCAYRLMVLPDVNAAVDLYQEALLFPGPSTEGHLLTQHGLRVNGPLFPNPAEGSASLLVGATSGGRPVVVKLLPGGVSADGAQQPGGPEAEACRALMESKPADVPLVPVRVITFELGDEHKSTVGRAPGLYAALSMPRYVSSLAQMVPLPAAAVLAGGKRMAAALEWIHDKKYTHMDVKADNIFVDYDGRWWLGDFGSTVHMGSPVTSTTIWFAPCKLLDLPAKPEYDWHMLAVALVFEMNRHNWKDLLVEGGCTPEKNLVAAVKELHGREGCEELACFLDELLQRAGYLAALA